MKIVVIITDCIDIACNELHQTLMNELCRLKIQNVQIAPLVAVKNFSVIHASFSIRLLAELYPEGTVFVVVVSGVGSNPARIFGETKNGLIFVGNNSGYFHWLFQDFGLRHIYENTLNREINGRSFGGKYVQIPTAARILSNENWDAIGVRRGFSFANPMEIGDGTIVHSDNFGLMKIKGPRLSGLSEGERLEIFLNGKRAVDGIYSEKMKRQKEGEWVLFPGSSLHGLPELGRVRSQNSAAELHAKEGDVITWQRKEVL